MKELEITVRIRNNRIKERRRALGLTQKELGKAAGISATSVCAFEGCRYEIVHAWGEDGWTPAAHALANFFNVDEKELFSDAALAVTTNEITRAVDGVEVLGLVEAPPPALIAEHSDPVVLAEQRDAVRAALDALALNRPRHARAVELRYGLDGRGERTLLEVGKDLGVTRERARQMVLDGERCLASTPSCRSQMEGVL
mgnify:CR=1 FL=1